MLQHELRRCNLSPVKSDGLRAPRGESMKRHIVCERDVGLFSLVQQVIAHIPWALNEDRVPIVRFGEKTCYWTPGGHRGADSVWEYYFRPLVPGHGAATIPRSVRDRIARKHPSAEHPGYFVDTDTFASSHFGDHAELEGKTLRIPYLSEDPDESLRAAARRIIDRFIVPRPELTASAGAFYCDQLAGDYVIGVHARGTDATSAAESRPHRQNSLVLPNYLPAVQSHLEGHPRARIFVATDEEASLRFFREHFGDRVCSYSTILHAGGEAAGTGPTGWIMPAYVAANRERAAQQGEEAIIDWLLLSRCDHLVHNGSSLARTALLMAPQMPHTNTHGPGAHRLAVDSGLISAVRSEKAKRRARASSYQERPKLAFIVHSFNRKSNVDQLVGGLRRSGDHELIVCDDGSIDGSRERWLGHLDGANDLLLCTNDLHEIRVLDRAITLARSEVVCLVQDDDVIPTTNHWVEEVLSTFDAHPQLAIVGGFMGFEAIGAGTVPLWGPCSFRFVHHVNIGPYFIRRSAYEELGGWDHSFSAVGEPGICFDSELCLRAWAQGYEVGYSFVPFKGQPGEYKLDGGTVLFAAATRLRNKVRNEAGMFSRYAVLAPDIDRRVATANLRLVQGRTPQEADSA